MSQKHFKKMRQFQRRLQDGFWGKALKPKPKWIPWGFWVWMAGFFIKIEEKEKI